MYPIRIHPTHKKELYVIPYGVALISLGASALALYKYSQGETEFLLLLAVVLFLDISSIRFWLRIRGQFSKCPTCNASLKVDTPREPKKPYMFTCEKCQTTWDSQVTPLF